MSLDGPSAGRKWPVSGYQTPSAIRRRGLARPTAWPANRGVRAADAVAATALEAAQAQHTALPGQDVAAQIVTDLATQILAWTTASSTSTGRYATPSAPTRKRRSSNPCRARAPSSGPSSSSPRATWPPARAPATWPRQPGWCPFARFRAPRRQPAPAQRYSRRLHRVFHLSAQTSTIREDPNRANCLKKRGEGCKHVQAVIALARRRASVLWALLRDNRAFTPTPPITQAA